MNERHDVSIPKTWKSPNEYHNAVVEESRTSDGNEGAYRMVLEGLSNYPYDIDLLADAVLLAPTGIPSSWKYGGDLDTLYEEKARELASKDASGLVYAEDFCVILMARYDRWNWRAFCHVADYLVERRATVLSSRDLVKKTLRRAVEISKDFVERFGSDDRAYNQLAEAHIANGERDEAERMLRRLILEKPASFPLPQCCVTLMDILMEKGEREDALQVARAGQVGTAQTQPTARMGYFVYCEALLMDSLLMGDYVTQQGEAADWEEKARGIISRYRIAESMLSERDTYINTIQQRKALLKGLFCPGDPEDHPEDRSRDCVSITFDPSDPIFRAILWGQLGRSLVADSIC